MGRVSWTKKKARKRKQRPLLERVDARGAASWSWFLLLMDRQSSRRQSLGLPLDLVGLAAQIGANQGHGALAGWRPGPCPRLSCFRVALLMREHEVRDYFSDASALAPLNERRFYQRSFGLAFRTLSVALGLCLRLLACTAVTAAATREPGHF